MPKSFVLALCLTLARLPAGIFILSENSWQSIFGGAERRLIVPAANAEVSFTRKKEKKRKEACLFVLSPGFNSGLFIC